jgi:hypothetical protein
LIRQQPLAPQQSAERAVAFAVPTRARAAIIISRYFIRILLLNLVSLLRQLPDEPTPLSNRKSRRWNLRGMRPDQLTSRESGKRFLARGRINERRRRSRQDGQAKDAARATLLLLVRFRGMPGAPVSRFLRLRPGAATCLLRRRNGSLCRDHCERDRAREQERDENSERRSHIPTLHPQPWAVQPPILTAITRR